MENIIVYQNRCAAFAPVKVIVTHSSNDTNLTGRCIVGLLTRLNGILSPQDCQWIVYR